MMTIKDNSSRQILIAAILTITLQSGIVAGIAIHNYRISNVETKVEFINKNYIPTFFLEGMIENMNFQTSEIVATMNGDAKRIHEINEKYLTFQKAMLNNLIQMQRGISNSARGGGKVVVDTSVN